MHFLLNQHRAGYGLTIGNIMTFKRNFLHSFSSKNSNSVGFFSEFSNSAQTSMNCIPHDTCELYFPIQKCTSQAIKALPGFGL